jgi:hypothetical protein
MTGWGKMKMRGRMTMYEVQIFDHGKSVLCYDHQAKLISLNFSRFGRNMICPEEIRGKWLIGILSDTKVGFQCNTRGELANIHRCYDGFEPSIKSNQASCEKVEIKISSPSTEDVSG